MLANDYIHLFLALIAFVAFLVLMLMWITWKQSCAEFFFLNKSVCFDSRFLSRLALATGSAVLCAFVSSLVLLLLQNDNVNTNDSSDNICYLSDDALQLIEEKTQGGETLVSCECKSEVKQLAALINQSNDICSSFECPDLSCPDVQCSELVVPECPTLKCPPHSCPSDEAMLLYNKLRFQGISNQHYIISKYAKQNLVEGLKGDYFRVDFQVVNSKEIIKFKARQYTIPSFQANFQNSIVHFKKNILDLLAKGYKVNLFVRGSADRPQFPKQRQLESHYYPLIKYLKKTQITHHHSVLIKQ